MRQRPPTEYEKAIYIAQITEELFRMADTQNLQLIRHLMEMANVEANEVATRLAQRRNRTG